MPSSLVQRIRIRPKCLLFRLFRLWAGFVTGAAVLTGYAAEANPRTTWHFTVLVRKRQGRTNFALLAIRISKLAAAGPGGLTAAAQTGTGLDTFARDFQQLRSTAADFAAPNFGSGGICNSRSLAGGTTPWRRAVDHSSAAPESVLARSESALSKSSTLNHLLGPQAFQHIVVP